ncbi:OPT family oligopeptide transporter [Thermoanaerobacter wiegelii]|uniref:Oligopeptide transporter, OPT family n=1 Tax=Thermoanaerobacter wiegelii Rt8.B1 TaxID=697303 RepID=G2MRZ0_9THEO|nr:oligopeptide transporter, OPT family [Thermoanaerobacter wiegelii]AEM77736.1 oligopeptide transporter, OPT family [Thermoanaerobacter wiegelii Rt8.B1]
MQKEDLKNEGGFKPYVPADVYLPEITPTSVILGVILVIIFGAANAYLGLKVGMTVSASIPAAVVSMSILKGVLRRGTILENNIVQTLASAGEAAAAGVVFSIPALYFLDYIPSMLLISLITLFGGILGVIGMVIYRRYLIVEQHGILPYPEGTACAEILIAGDKGGVSAKMVFKGGIIAAIYRFVQSGLGLFPDVIETSIPKLPGGVIGGNVLPALVGVGYLIGYRVSAIILAGGLLAWLVIIPLFSFIGTYVNTPIFPSQTPLSQLDAWGMWADYIQYIGAGALTVGGLFEFFKALPVVKDAILSSFSKIKANGSQKILRTEMDIPFPYIVITFLAIVVLIALIPQMEMNIMGAFLTALFGFLFVSISSRIVGVVGSSSNPVSGMTIATIFISAIVMKSIGYTGIKGMVTTVVIGAIVTVAAAIAGDTSQDLKTGYIVGATPRAQQIIMIPGILIFAGMSGFVLTLLNNAYHIGSSELPSPATAVIAVLVKGVFAGNLPWGLLLIGAAIGIIVELMGIASLPFAIGLYLPVHLSVPIFIGGFVRNIVEKYRSNGVESGTLYASGLVAGDALVGIILALFTTAGIADKLAIASGLLNNNLASLLALVLILIIAYTLYTNSRSDEVSE